MKKIIPAFIFMAGLLSAFLSGQAQKPAQEGNLSLSGAWALYPMAIKWQEEFQKIHPKVRIDVQAGGAGKGIADVLSGAVDIGMVSRDIQKVEVDKGALPIAVTKDAVVPMISAKNPLLREILKKGLKRDQFLALWINEQAKTWGGLVGVKNSAPVRVFTRSDACGAAETWAAYMGKKQEDLKGVGIYGDPGLAEAVRREPLAVGYNNVNYAFDPKTLKPVAGLSVLPIDINENGVVDPEEDFYADRDRMTKAIAEGRYPSPPARNLFFVTKGKPQKPLLVEFIKWVLTGGQKYVPETGYINLSAETLAEGLRAIGEK